MLKDRRKYYEHQRSHEEQAPLRSNGRKKDPRGRHDGIEVKEDEGGEEDGQGPSPKLKEGPHRLLKVP